MDQKLSLFAMNFGKNTEANSAPTRFRVGHLGLDEAVQRYKEWMQRTEQIASLNEAKATLRGKNLGCWCGPGLLCHADVLRRLVNPKWESVDASLGDEGVAINRFETVER